MPAFLGPLLRGNETFQQLSRFFRADADPWERLEVPLPPQVFGQACNRSFEAYLGGPSRIEIRSVEDVCEFLRR